MEDIIKQTDEEIPVTPQDDGAAAANGDTEAVEGEVTGSAILADEENNVEVKEEGDNSYYERLEKEDLLIIHRHFPESAGITSVTQLDNPLRYAALRDMGLTPREAYLATQSRRGGYDNRNHLRGSVPSAAGAASGAMSQTELNAARELFAGLSDRELQRLYKTVTK